MTTRETEKKFELEFKFKLVVGLICGALFIILIVWTTYKAFEKDRVYPTIHSDDTASGTVISVERERSWVRVTLSDRSKLTIRGPKDLVEFIGYDDIFVKKQDSDTIYVTRDGTIHKFNISAN